MVYLPIGILKKWDDDVVGRREVTYYCSLLLVMILNQLSQKLVANGTIGMMLPLLIVVGGVLLPKLLLKESLWRPKSEIINAPAGYGLLAGLVIAFGVDNLIDSKLGWALQGGFVSFLFSLSLVLIFSLLFAQIEVSACLMLLSPDRQFSVKALLLTAAGWLLPCLVVGWMQQNLSVVWVQLIVWAVASFGMRMFGKSSFAVGVVTAFTAFMLVAP